MQKMKNGLMMFCLTVLLSCAALMMNTPTASAMTLADLQGDYRIMNSHSSADNCNGTIISLAMENVELIGRIKKPSSGVANVWKPGDIFMKDVFVQNGNVHFQFFNQYGNFYSGTIIIKSNGNILDLRWDEISAITLHELHRM